MVYAELKDPQTLNKYSYVVGNPLTTTDPDGHCPDKKPCPALSETSALISEIPANVISDVTIGAGKAIANIGIGVNNFSNYFLNGDDPNYSVQPFEPTSKVQFISQHATEVLTLVAPLLSGFGPATVVTSSSRQTTAVAAETGNAVERAATLKPGAFATESIPARGPGRQWNAAENAFRQQPGQCHTCGTTNPGTRSGSWVLDHQPVSALNSTNAPQSLFRQCLACSQRQGGEVRAVLQQRQQTTFTERFTGRRRIIP